MKNVYKTHFYTMIFLLPYVNKIGGQNFYKCNIGTGAMPMNGLQNSIKEPL